MIELVLADTSSPASAPLMARMQEIYHSSFPAEERRPWPDLVQKIGKEIECYWVMSDGVMVGFITMWRLGQFCYVEHFATDTAVRGKGIGAEAMRQLLATRAGGLPVVLEAEPATTGAMARRRIAFYERCGFEAQHHYSYTQPPYAADLPPVGLTLMVAGDGAGELELDAVAATLHRQVYKKMS